MLYARLLNYDFKSLFEKKHYAFFTKGAYNLNIIGVRSKGNIVKNTFDDYIVLIYNTPANKEIRRCFPITTDPGLTYIKKPIASGTAILVPGQYRGAFKMGLHKNKYSALVQCKPVKVYRDRNKDNKYDFDEDTIEEGIFGINIHKAGTNSVTVNNWSAGCQVFANTVDYESFLRYCRNQIKAGLGDTFTYTLIREEDL